MLLKADKAGFWIQVDWEDLGPKDKHSQKDDPEELV